MSGGLKPPSGWSWSSERWARTNQRQTFSARGLGENLILNERHSSELSSLAQETDPEMFFTGWLVLGRRLEKEGDTSSAAAVYNKVASSAPSPQIRGEAQSHFEALSGRGAFSLRAEFFIKNFTASATDYRAIAPMIAGSAVYRVVRTASLHRLLAAPASWYSRGLAASFGASLAGMAVEVPVFALGASQDFCESALTLGALKFSSYTGHKILASPALSPSKLARAVTPPAVQFFGLMGAHHVTGQPGTAADILGSMVSLGVGSHLGHKLLGTGFAHFQTEITLRGGATPRSSPPIFFEGKASTAGVNSASVRSPSLEIQKPRPLLMEIKGSGGSAEKPDLTRYADLLQHGIRNEADLELAREFFQEIDPESAGRLALASRNIPHRFETLGGGKTGGQNLGATQITFSQQLDRSQGGNAEAVILGVPVRKKGLPLFVLPHEWTHATELSPEQLAVFPKIRIDGTLREIYDTVLANRYWDEALAFASELQLEEAFLSRTGESLYGIGVHRAMRKDHGQFSHFYWRQGVKGIFQWISSYQLYLPYKIGSLYLAILIKQGLRDFPKWEDILQGLGIKEFKGHWTLPAASLRNFYNLHLKPLFQNKGLETILIGSALANQKTSAWIARAIRYFAGDMSFHDAAEFLEKDFDHLVDFIGGMMDRPNAAQTPSSSALLPNVENHLPPRPVPMRTGNPGEFNHRPQTVADKVEVASKYVEFLSRIYLAPDIDILNYWKNFLKYAEQADPVSAARIYSRLKAVVATLRGQNSGNSDYPIQLGVSLLRSGYREEGLAILEAVFSAPLKFLSSLALKELISLNEPEKITIWLERALRSPALAPYVVLLELLEAVTSMTSEELESLPPFVPTFLETQAKKEWALMRSHIKEEMKRVEKEYGPAESVEEWKAADYKLFESLTFSKETYFISACLRNPLLFRAGLSFLKDFPSGEACLKLYRQAVEQFPQSFSDAERLDLAQAYQAVLNNQRKAFNRQAARDWKPSPVDFFAHSLFRSVHLYSLAKLYFSSKIEETKKVGARLLLDQLSKETKEHPSDHSMAMAGFAPEIKYGDSFHPFLGRLTVLLKSLPHLEPEERRGFFEESFASLTALRTSSANAHQKVRFLVRLAEAAVEYGFNGLAQKIIAAWNQGLERTLETSALLAKSRKDLDFNRQSAEVKSQARFSFSLITALLEGDAAMEEFTRRVGRDVTGKRGLFRVEHLIRGFSFLSLPKIRSQVADFDLHMEALAQSASTLYIESGDQLGSVWKSLVNQLIEIPVAPSVRDRIFAHLIETATPEPGVYSRDVQFWYMAIEAYRSLKFLIGNSETPEAEVLLLNRFARSLRSLDWQSRATLSGSKEMDWIFDRLADAQILDPNRRETLAALRSDEEYRSSLTRLFPFLLESEQPVNGVPIWDQYRSALGAQDLAQLKNLAPELARMLAKELILASVAETRGSDEGPQISPMLTVLVEDWKQAQRGGPLEIAELLFPLWVESKDPAESGPKLNFYLEALSEKGLALTFQRRIFEELDRFHLISSYAIQLWKRILETKDVETEMIFYELFMPPRLNKEMQYLPADNWLTHVTELPSSERKVFINRYRGFLASPRRWHADLTNAMDWDIYAEFHKLKNSWALVWRQNMKSLLGAMVYLKNPWRREEFANIAARLRLELGISESDAAMEGYLPDPVPQKNKRFATLPSAEEAAALIPLLLKHWRHREKIQDRIKMDGFEMPEAFRGRDGLTQFLLSRFFVEMGSGEQQTLLQGIKHVSPERALRIFFEKSGLEKLGQFLSFWPEVPETIREELRSLQDQVAPGDFEEVKATIRAQLGKGKTTKQQREIASILQNLDPRPLGSGTMGECYRSRLSNGQEVVVKVIPPSKEKKFRKALERAKNVRYLLSLYREDFAGAPEALRVMDLFFEMVEKEWDLRHEKGNGEVMTLDLPEGIAAPVYLPGFTTEKVSVQTFAKGVKLEAISDPDVKRRAIERLLDFFAKEQVAAKGRFHSDLQPGNLLYDETSGKIWLLDFGQVGELSPQERLQVQVLGYALSNQNVELAADVLKNMAEPKDDFSTAQLVQALKTLFSDPQFAARPASAKLMPIYKLTQRHGLVLKLPYLQLLKAIATFDSTVQTTMG